MHALVSFLKTIKIEYLLHVCVKPKHHTYSISRAIGKNTH